MTPPVKVNLARKFSEFEDHWVPKVVGEVNDFQVKVAKLQGEFVWHHHEEEDELFLVQRGQLRIEFRDGEVLLEPGEMVIVPRGIEHRPIADEEVQLVLFERSGTVNTGNVFDERTVAKPKRI
jgi:mannose-6-phosphate isomerase-like protein (cupin superfamily)